MTKKRKWAGGVWFPPTTIIYYDHENKTVRKVNDRTGELTVTPIAEMNFGDLELRVAAKSKKAAKLART